MQDRVIILLARARNPHNIGAAARAMHDFGFPHLRIVNDYPVPFEAARSAVDASAVLTSAQLYPTLAEATADCTLILGTSAVGDRALQHPLHTLADAASLIARHLGSPDQPSASPTRVALLFGSEKTGLSNEELSHCHALLTIPMHPQPDLRHPSMNLGQAVAVCLYELVRTRPIPVSPGPRPASAESLERLTLLLSDLLEQTGYRRHHPAHSDLEDLRRLVFRLNLSAADLPVWMGILRQFQWHQKHYV